MAFGLVGLLVTIPWWLPFLQSYFAVVGELARSSSSTLDTRAIERLTDQLENAAVPLTLLPLVVSVLLRVLFHSRWGATPGKMALGIRVRRVGRPGPLTVLEALRREAITVAAALVGLIPFVGIIGAMASRLDELWLLWDPRRQTLHDKVADTVVEVRPRPAR
jgi:uncharacterized RDD family membrane protein YckC